jgi:hypothetical protein
MPFSAYSFFMKLAIKLIARWHGMPVRTSQDYDLTDYAVLGAFIDRFVASALLSNAKDPMEAPPVQNRRPAAAQGVAPSQSRG